MYLRFLERRYEAHIQLRSAVVNTTKKRIACYELLCIAGVTENQLHDKLIERYHQARTVLYLGLTVRHLDTRSHGYQNTSTPMM